VLAAEPYDTLGTVALGLLMLLYAVGLPTTVVISAVAWRNRTRGRLAPAAPAAVPPASGWAAAPPSPAGSPIPPGAYTALATAPQTEPGFAPSPVGPALLRLHSLERQVLALREAPVPAEQYRRLAAEAGDLLDRSGAGSPAGRHAAGLLAIVEALAASDLPIGDPPPPGMPDRLRVGLGRFAVTGRPVPADWALAWLASLPERPAVAGAEFIRRYQAAYPQGGMVLPWTGDRLTLRYVPASARFGGQPLEIPTGLPDVAAQPGPAQRLRELAGEAR
jgi:hypothetical protein